MDVYFRACVAIAVYMVIAFHISKDAPHAKKCDFQTIVAANDKKVPKVALHCHLVHLWSKSRTSLHLCKRLDTTCFYENLNWPKAETQRKTARN